MTQRKSLCLFLSLFLIVWPLLPHSAQAGDDWELWTELKWKKKLAPAYSLYGGFYNRFRRNLGEFYKSAGYLGLSVKAAPWLKVEPFYLHDFSERPRSHDTVEENRLFLNFIPQLHLGPFRLEDRNRLEWRRINGVEDWRYRNKPKIGVDLLEDTSWEFQPFIADEIFYGFRAGELNRNRFFAGVEKPLSKRLAVELYYMVESNRTGSDWAEFHALGFSATVVF